MKVLLISPMGFAINEKTTYAGIERLVWEYSRELIKRGHQVGVLARNDSIFPEGVELLGIEPLPDHSAAEIKAFQSYQYRLRSFDVIHDFSHLHLVARMMANMPTLNIFWHAPALAQYPKAPYNIIALSQWAAREYQRVYRQAARYQQSIALDVDLYRPIAEPRNNRFLCVGRMGEEKGNLHSAQLCKTVGVDLDIITARGAGVEGTPYTDYEKEVIALADGEHIRIWWEKDYTEATKIHMMQTNKALLYTTDHPEVTSHKIQECLLTNMPVIVPCLGALPEIVTQGVDGFLCSSEAEYVKAVKNVDKLDPSKTYEQTKARFSVGNVVENYLPLYEQVGKGLRW